MADCGFHGGDAGRPRPHCLAQLHTRGPLAIARAVSVAGADCSSGHLAAAAAQTGTVAAGRPLAQLRSCQALANGLALQRLHGFVLWFDLAATLPMAYTAALGSDASLQTVAEKSGVRVAMPAAISSSWLKWTISSSSSASMKKATNACPQARCQPCCPCAKATSASWWTAFACPILSKR